MRSVSCSRSTVALARSRYPAATALRRAINRGCSALARAGGRSATRSVPSTTRVWRKTSECSRCIPASRAPISRAAYSSSVSLRRSSIAWSVSAARWGRISAAGSGEKTMWARARYQRSAIASRRAAGGLGSDRSSASMALLLRVGYAVRRGCGPPAQGLYPTPAKLIDRSGARTKMSSGSSGRQSGTYTTPGSTSVRSTKKRSISLRERYCPGLVVPA